MKNKKLLLIICCIVILACCFIGIKLTGSSFGSLKYNVVVEEHRFEYEGVEGEIPATGYSSNYFYTLVNTKKKEKYEITYQDVWDVHNEKGDKDKLSYKITKLSNIEVRDYEEKYGKSDKLKKVKSLVATHTKEKYDIEKEK